MSVGVAKGPKVLFVHDGPIYKDCQEHYYGVHYNDTLISRYKRLGKDVTFMMRVYRLNDIEKGKYSKINHENFEVVSVPNFKSIRLFLKNKSKAETIISKTVLKHDIVVARLPSAIGSLAIKYAKKYNKALLVEYVACTYDAYWNFSWQGKLIAYYKMKEQQRIMKDVPFCMYVTQNFLQKRYPTDGKQIGCSDVELHVASDNQLQVRLNQINTRDSSKPLILATIAALDIRYKGQADVIKAISLLKKEGVRMKYQLVGQGNQSYLESVIKEHEVEDLVTIIGPLKHNEVFDFLRQVEVYIQPSKQEGLPRAPIEAMSTGCLVLGSDVGGTPELLDDEMIFPAGDIKTIVLKLKKINRTQMLKQAQRNFEHAKLYQKEKLEKKRNEFYNLFLRENNLEIEA